MSELGAPDVAEVIETKTVSFTVKRHIRPKMRCCKCSTVVQAPAPSRPLQRSFAGASFLALILVWKYGFHVPLYRQCQIFAHSGLKISRTTLMQWVAGSTALLGPLVEALARYVLAGKINADDTPVKVLAPGTGKTKRGYLWAYVRDGRPWKSRDPPAAWYRYSPDRKGHHPQRHLRTYQGKLQVDAYAGFEALFVPPAPDRPANIVEVACWAHVRRGLFDLYEAKKSPTAKEALDRIGKLYEIEDSDPRPVGRAAPGGTATDTRCRCSMSCIDGCSPRARRSKTNPSSPRRSTTRSIAGGSYPTSPKMARWR